MNFIDDFAASQEEIFYLYYLSHKQKGADDNRRYLLNRLYIIKVVILLEVLIESSLEEFQQTINNSCNSMKFGSTLRAATFRNRFEDASKKLQNQNVSFYEEYIVKNKSHINGLFSSTKKRSKIANGIQIHCKFRMGKHGTKEIRRLFGQIDKDDIFEKLNVDSNVFDSLLTIRHGLIHNNSKTQIDETILDNYYAELFKFASGLNEWLESLIDQYK